MTLNISDQEFALIRNFIHDQCGIYLGDNKKYLIETRLSGLATSSGCRTFGEFYLKLKNSSIVSKLRGDVVDAITTNETMWFRDQHPFRILEESIFPEYYEQIKNGKKKQINVWSAACSTGQEPYSIAMKTLDFFQGLKNDKGFPENVKILATDISNGVIKTAMAGRYDSIAMTRGITPKIIDQYFTKNKNEWIIKDKVKNLITFKSLNINESSLALFGPFDIVFVRNVIIYFSDAIKKSLLYKVSRLLSPSGYLFLGTGETVGGYCDLFEIIESKGAMYYRLK
ncbi:MAG: protein-glutamate O-methyltransferase CheR [Desulfobacterales bacterium]|nr:protein-glutamate O-methyltransferase CheR [Desulfobacterales bacterium]